MPAGDCLPVALLILVRLCPLSHLLTGLTWREDKEEIVSNLLDSFRAIQGLAGHGVELQMPLLLSDLLTLSSRLPLPSLLRAAGEVFLPS